MGAAEKQAYREKLLDPRWQRRRLEIFQRDDFSCQLCHDTTKTLHVHHRWYHNDLEPWEAEDSSLVTLCSSCHKEEGFTRNALENELIDSFRRVGFSAHDLNMLMGSLSEYEFRHGVMPQNASYRVMVALAFVLWDDELLELSLARAKEHMLRDRQRATDERT